jgi:putative (di)nucleoside polyphosphate hydrolase
MALTELSKHLPRHDQKNRYMRGNQRAKSEGTVRSKLVPQHHIELPPGATFDPDPGHHA